MDSPSKTLELLNRFSAEIQRTVEAPEPDQVHDLRVAIRRLSQALATLQKESAVAAEIRRKLRRIMKQAGAVRDCDIVLKLASKEHASRRFETRIHVRRGEAEQKLLRAITRWAGGTNRWAREIRKAKALDVRESGAIGKSLKKLYKLGAAAEKSDHRLHHLRIAAKKLRYTLELVDTLKPAMETIKTLQSQLGDIHDYQMARVVGAEESLSKRVVARFEKKEQKKIAAFRRFWRDEFAGRKREWRAKLQAAPSRSQVRERQGAA
jgi:CHAD domain-containing protein